MLSRDLLYHVFKFSQPVRTPILEIVLTQGIAPFVDDPFPLFGQSQNDDRKPCVTAAISSLSSICPTCFSATPRPGYQRGVELTTARPASSMNPKQDYRFAKSVSLQDP